MEIPLTILENKKAELVYLKNIAIKIYDMEMASEIEKQIHEVSRAIDLEILEMN